jgi:hypothetical protein
MKTSNEIKNFIVGCICSRKIFDLYFEIFEELKGTTCIRELKAVNYRWAAACNEVHKEFDYDMIDETFCRSLICYNTVLNFRDKNVKESTKRLWKAETGWDAEAIANGKHCKLAQIIIDALEKSRKHQEIKNEEEIE